MIWRVAPYVATFGLMATTLAWQDGVERDVVADVDSAPEVMVAEHQVPTVRVAVAPESARSEPSSSAAVPSEAPSAAPTAGSEETAEPAQPVVIAELKPQPVKPFSLMGVTWASGMPKTAAISVQWHGTKGWSDWTDLHQELVPSEDENGRPGTEPQWVEWADAVAVRVTSPEAAKPADIQVATIDPGKDSAITPMAATQPAIILRSQWGAKAQTSCNNPAYGKTTLGAVIHHTVGSNSYSQSQSAGIVRATQAYHMKNRGWCDIGYNFLVDRYGQIFEGRAGGINRPVWAAHAGNKDVNAMTMGVSLMGTFTSEAPTSAMKAATARLVAWRFAAYKVPAKGTYSLGGKVLNRIAGHRNVISTACPGEVAYAWIGTAGGLRDVVAGLLAGGGSPPAPSGPRIAKFGARVLGPTSIRWSWTPVAGAARYYLAVATNPNLHGYTLFKTTSTSKRVDVLKPGRTYYAAVRAVNAKGKAITPFTATLARTTPPASAAPKAPTPAPAAAGVPTGVWPSDRTASSVTLTWKPVSGAASYQVRLSRWTTMADAVAQPSKKPNEKFKNLRAGTRYYVQVRALRKDGKAIAGWSPRLAVNTRGA